MHCPNDGDQIPFEQNDKVFPFGMNPLLHVKTAVVPLKNGAVVPYK